MQISLADFIGGFTGMRYVIGLSFAALAIWVLQATGILTALIVFLMIGTVPGTRISISPVAMLLLLAALSALVVYWLLRQRPPQRIQPVQRTYHKQTAAETAALARRPPHFMAGLRHSLKTTRFATYRYKNRLLTRTSNWLDQATVTAARIIRPLQVIVITTAIITVIAARELVLWARPHIKRTIAWLRLQARYSVKGTMLSAHRWSSLSKKLLSSLTSLLSRCSSALKRGKSLLTRAAR